MSNERHYTLAGHHVVEFLSEYGTFWTLPCLAGDDCSCRIGEITLEAIPGGMKEARNGGEIKVTPGETLRGWGSLDGPSYNLSPEGCAWWVSVPVKLWEEFLALHLYPYQPHQLRQDFLRFSAQYAGHQYMVWDDHHVKE